MSARAFRRRLDTVAGRASSNGVPILAAFLYDAAEVLRMRSVLSIFLMGIAVPTAVIAQPTTELLIRNGVIVNADGTARADLRIENETIAEIGPTLSAGPDARVIDASGLLLIPRRHRSAYAPRPQRQLPRRLRERIGRRTCGGRHDDLESGTGAAR